MFRSHALVCFFASFAGDVDALSLKNPVHGSNSNGDIVHLFSDSTAARVGTDKLQHAFQMAYKSFNRSFDFKAMNHLAEEFQEGLERYRTTDAYTSYAYYPDRPHCDKGVAVTPRHVSGMAAFPGGISERTFGLDFSQSIGKLSAAANGPASAGLVLPTALLSQGLNMGMGMVQTVAAAVLHEVPPLVPPPVWNNQPLPCVPMLTGHNCFGAVLYPITMPDFMIADVTDSMLDGVIAGFPNTYASKVGKTNDAMYKACFSSYMSMHCSSIFPMCSAPQSRDEPMPAGGRVPMCLHLCIMPLVMCPGFWVSDIIGSCSMVSVPPMCTQAFFLNLWRLPPQYASFDDANPFPKECPKTDFSGMDAAEDPALYDVSAPTSPILEEASAAKGPSIASL